MKTRDLRPAAAALMLAAAVTAVASAPTAATQAQAGWDAWIGCWQQLGPGSSGEQLVCVLPGSDAQSVRMATVEGGVITDETVVRADGMARPVDDEGCTGSETASFSRDQRRIFTRAELDCRGVRRVSTGVLAMISADEWVDAQAVTVAGQAGARTVRYGAVPRAELPASIAAALPSEQPMALEAARMQAAVDLAVDDVIEAAAHIDAPALEALLGATQQGFPLDARMVTRLADSGVATSTIDVMIALSYPSRFAVQERGEQDAAYERGVDRGMAMRAECYDPYVSRRYRASCYGLGYGSVYYDGYGRYGYSPWGYDRYGWHYGSSPIIIVQPQPGTPAPRGGTVVKGRGFTSGDQPSRGQAQPRSQPSTDRSSASGTSSGSSASTPSTSSGSSTGRTARPRSGGGRDPGGSLEF